MSFTIVRADYVYENDEGVYTCILDEVRKSKRRMKKKKKKKAMAPSNIYVNTYRLKTQYTNQIPPFFFFYVYYSYLIGKKGEKNNLNYSFIEFSSNIQ